MYVQDKHALQQQLSAESSARTAAEQQVHALQRQLSSASAECTNCKQVWSCALTLPCLHKRLSPNRHVLGCTA